MYKRKHRSDDGWDESATRTSRSQPTDDIADPCLYIQAHEADVIRGPLASSARLLECQNPSVMMDTGGNSRSGLIRWGPLDRSGGAGVDEPALWVDRYDVRLLLDHLPCFQSENTPARPLSPSGWSDLPSDSEDTFFFSPDELEDYRREKRRRLIDRGREERLRALATIDGHDNDMDRWGSSDEEPDDAQRELIRRTASHISSSPNPAQLEMRILANYGTDKRFAFLRGRWSRVWRTEKERAKRHHAEEAKKIQMQTPLAPTSLGGLASYGDSDSDSDSEDSANKPTEKSEDDPSAQNGHREEDSVKEARRTRAKEWSARRRAERSESVQLA